MIRAATLCFTTCFILQFSAPAQVSTVNYNAAPGERNVVDSSGTPLADGNIAAVGYFTPGFNVTNNASDFTALQSAWHLYGETTIEHLPKPPAPGAPGYFAGSSSQSDPSFTGQPIYLWITDTNLAGTVTEYGLFRSTASNWVFPDPLGTPPANSTLINSSEVDTFIFGSSLGSSPGSLQLANVVTVPEPSAISIAVVGLLLGRLCLRRR